MEEVVELFLKLFNTTAFLNYVTLIVYMVVIFYLSNILSDVANKILDTVGAYRPDSVKSYVGVPIHEFGHWIFAKLFMFRINETKFFPTKPQEGDNGRITLGYVNYSVRTDTNIFIRSLGHMAVAVGPIFSGSIVIILAGKLLCNNVIMSVYYFIQGSFKTDMPALQYIISNFYKLDEILTGDITVLYVIFIIFAVIVSDYMTLSGADLNGFYMGCIFITVLVFVLCFVPFVSEKVGKIMGICISYVVFFGVLSLAGQILNVAYASAYRLIKKIGGR